MFNCKGTGVVHDQLNFVKSIYSIGPVEKLVAFSFSVIILQMEKLWKRPIDIYPGVRLIHI